MSLRAIDITLELEDEAALTAFAATVGDHETLHYVPGACIMGYLAGRFYGSLKEEESRVLFHSDQVRFGDARILDHHEIPAQPSPRSWCYAKSQGKPLSGPDGNWLDRTRLHDDLLDDRDPRLRYKEFGGRELCVATGRLIAPRRRYRQATAIDPDANRAAEGQLFGYEGLEPGQCFGGRILFASQVPDALYQRVLEQLTDTRFFVGRSRSAQYGRLRCRARTAAVPLPGAPPHAQLTLWLLSDLAAWDEQGQPSLWPRAEWLGLPPGALVPDRTFLATRRYSPWNGYARSRDRERLVITRGSLLTFAFEGGWTDTHRERLALGLGGHLAYGLGETAVYPDGWDWPSASAPDRSARPALEGINLVQEPAPDEYVQGLLGWLGATGASDENNLEKKLSELCRLYEAYRRLHGLTADDREGPRKTHWAEVEGIATAGRDVRGKLEALPRVWRESTYGQGEDDHFAHWVQQWADRPEFLARLAAEARRRNIMGER